MPGIESTAICLRRSASGREYPARPRRREPPLPGPFETDRSQTAVSAPLSIPPSHYLLNRRRILSASVYDRATEPSNLRGGAVNLHLPTAVWPILLMWALGAASAGAAPVSHLE